MRPRALLLITLIFIYSCQTDPKPTSQLLEQLPQNASFFLKINDLTGFLSELKNSAISGEEGVLYFIDRILEQNDILNRLRTDQELLIGFYEIGKDTYDFLLATDSEPGFFDISQEKNHSTETLTYEGYAVTQYEFNEKKVFSSEKNGFQILSSSQMLLENLLRAKSYTPHSTVLRLDRASNKEKSAILLIDLSLDFPSSSKPNLSKTNGPLAEWTSVDVSMDQTITALNGITIASDSIKSFVNLFKGTNPLTNRTPDYAPSQTEALISYTFDDFKLFQKNQNQFLDRIQVNDTLFNTVEEVGLINLNQQKVVFLSSFGAEGLSEHLYQNKVSVSSYQGSEIVEFKAKHLIESTFTPLIVDFVANYYSILDNTFIFSETKEALQTVINNYRNKSTFAESAGYRTAKENFADESSLLFISNRQGAPFFAKQAFSSSVFQGASQTNLKNHTFAAQLIADNHLVHTNFLISKAKKTSVTNTTSPLFTLELDADLATNPQFVKNHRNNKQEIVVQDMDNNLYLISTQGKVLWKKQLEGRVQGPIQQVDLYKNGRLQLAFCTNNQFLVIDRNGNFVPPFTRKYQGGNLNPLAVFDYEGNKDYRFLVTQGKKVFMYNKKAEIVDGFTFTEAGSDIIQPPKHFRVSNKDYLLFPLEENSLKILHRVGRERISVKQKIDFSKNEIFLYKNKFSVTDKNGILVQIDTKGNITNTNFNLSTDHGMYATSKTLVFMDDNILSIRGKKVELDLGVYSKPKIFYIYDKIYVSVTDVQNQKIYLFDSQAVPIPNFPVYGNSLIDMVDMENDRKLEIVAKDQDNSLIVYKMN
nr:ribonuclease HII [uncultured Allomuricauda sp.]